MKKDFPSELRNYNVGIPSELRLVLCGGQRPIFTTKNTRWPPAQYSRHAACKNGQLGGDQGMAPASARHANRASQLTTRERGQAPRDQGTGTASARSGTGIG